ncbi:hypothetical protein [Ascidiimonas aurantiaca]|uniref:hypothetical protein n=1 Tax=Ascidiimonas aurantiaca TaxID=1685432 RepID=UPI0030EF4FC8
MPKEVNIPQNTSAVETGENYVKATRKYYHLKVFQQIAILSTSFVEVFIVGSLLLFGIVFMALSGAIALGKVFDNMALGYVCIAFLFVLFAGLVLLLRKRIFKSIIRKLSKTYFN